MKQSEYIFLERIYERKKPRKDWSQRWSAAVKACKGKGVYIPKQNEGYIMGAKKDSPVWKELARGAGGYRDTIGKGEPPFCYGSGMGWRSQPKSQEERLQEEIKRQIEKMKLPKKINVVFKLSF